MTSQLPEWVDAEWRKEIAEKYAIKEAGDELATLVRKLALISVWGRSSELLAVAKVALEKWEKANAKEIEPCE